MLLKDLTGAPEGLCISSRREKKKQQKTAHINPFSAFALMEAQLLLTECTKYWDRNRLFCGGCLCVFMNRVGSTSCWAQTRQPDSQSFLTSSLNNTYTFIHFKILYVLFYSFFPLPSVFNSQGEIPAKQLNPRALYKRKKIYNVGQLPVTWCSMQSVKKKKPIKSTTRRPYWNVKFTFTFQRTSNQLETSYEIQRHKSRWLLCVIIV